MEQKDRIVAKINALLAKTTDNGASSAEMESAMNMAQKLMIQNFITEHDIKDTKVAEKCKLKRVEIIKVGYDIKDFYASLARLFDCKYYFTSRYISFFGHEQDTELCEYFYSLVVRTCINESKRYQKSEEFKDLKKYGGYHGRTLVSSFCKGFIIKVAYKMNDMYRNRESSLPPSYGLMVADKIKKVASEFNELNTKIRTLPPKEITAQESAFNSGIEKGEDMILVQAIESKKSQLVPQLN